MNAKKMIFEDIAEEYSMILLNWAYKKIADKEKAEDLAQEVFLQIYTAIEKSDKNIIKKDNFVWKVAHYTWCNYLRNSKHYKRCISIDEIVDASIDDFADEIAKEQEQKEILQRMRERISRLAYLKREIMISFYLEGKSIKEIAKKYFITEANVKWHLHSTRKSIREEIMMEQQEYVYRPKKLHMGISGIAVAALDTKLINNSLAKQNICLACYYNSKTKEELVEMLGIPMAYMQDDLEWLVEKEFMIEEKGHYMTSFMIETPNQSQAIYEIYHKHKENLVDVIINGLIAREDEIRKIEFYGNHIPMDKLLWLLIYQFCNNQPNSVMIEPTIRPDGGKYFPLGFDRSDFEDVCEYRKGWSYNGPMGNNNFMWFGTYNFGTSDIEKVIDAYDTGWATLQEMLKKIIYENPKVALLSENERDLSAELAQKGFIKMEDGRAYPNFYIFSIEQYEKLRRDIFKTISMDIEEELVSIRDDFAKYFEGKIPKQLKNYKDLFISMALSDLVFIATMMAFQDDKLYVPKTARDGEFLTLMYIKSIF